MIDIKLKIISFIFLLIIFLVICYFVKKNKIIIKYAIIWYISLLILMFFTLFPNLLSYITHMVGMELNSNFIFTFLITFLIVLVISLTIIVSEQKEQLKVLIQELSILKSQKTKKTK